MRNIPFPIPTVRRCRRNYMHNICSYQNLSLMCAEFGLLLWHQILMPHPCQNGMQKSCYRLPVLYYWNMGSSKYSLSSYASCHGTERLKDCKWGIVLMPKSNQLNYNQPMFFPHQFDCANWSM